MGLDSSKTFRINYNLMRLLVLTNNLIFLLNTLNISSR